MKYFSILVSVMFLFACSSKKEEAKQEEAETEAETPQIQEPIGGNESLDWFNPIDVVGMGLLSVHQNYPFRIEEIGTMEGERFSMIRLYNDEACTELCVEYNFIEGGHPVGYKIIPLYYKVDYGVYRFVTTKENAASYEVAINPIDRKYIKKEKNINYQDWKTFYTEAYYLLAEDETPYRVSANDDAKIVILNEAAEEGLLEERVVKIEGDWLQITFPKLPEQKAVWVRWKNGERVILRVAVSA